MKEKTLICIIGTVAVTLLLKHLIHFKICLFRAHIHPKRTKCHKLGNFIFCKSSKKPSDYFKWKHAANWR